MAVLVGAHGASVYRLAETYEQQGKRIVANE